MSKTWVLVDVGRNVQGPKCPLLWCGFRRNILLVSQSTTTAHNLKEKNVYFSRKFGFSIRKKLQIATTKQLFVLYLSELLFLLKLIFFLLWRLYSFNGRHFTRPEWRRCDGAERSLYVAHDQKKKKKDPILYRKANTKLSFSNNSV